MDDFDQKAERDKLYTRCLQVNHPSHHGWSYGRWNTRGICSLLVNRYDAPVSYNQNVANETDTVLRDNDCVRIVDRGKELSDLDFTGARLIDADLPRTNLSRANLTGANLTGANLTGANLSRADLTGVNLTGANLTGANLSRANLTV